jgi:uncharacterized damage-inducible protein DinB
MPSSDRKHVLRRYEFHHWATDRVFDALSSVTAEQLDQEWGGSFGTGRALLRHVVGVEWLWYERWNVRSPKALPDYPTSWSGRDFKAAWDKVKADQEHFLQGVTATLLAAELSYVNMKGVSARYRFAEVFEHCVNHGTYHRGQITHLLRDLGLSAPSTDYLLFVEERRESSK